eukprot:scaffold581_cov169-Amphora_coffeaeformis.AAC.11
MIGSSADHRATQSRVAIQTGHSCGTSEKDFTKRRARGFQVRCAKRYDLLFSNNPRRVYIHVIA